MRYFLLSTILSALLNVSAIAKPLDTAIAGQWADSGITLYAVSEGHTEVNPLGWLLIGAKWFLVRTLKTTSCEFQESTSPAIAAVGWGATGYNAAIVFTSLSAKAMGAQSAALAFIITESQKTGCSNTIKMVNLQDVIIFQPYE